MAYSPPPGNLTSSVDFFTWLNSTISNWFFPGVIVAVYFILLIKLMYNSPKIGQAFTSASFICMILTVLLRITDLIGNSFMIIFIILTAIGAVWMHTENARIG